jgi:hypothetical protein
MILPQVHLSSSGTVLECSVSSPAPGLLGLSSGEPALAGAGLYLKRSRAHNHLVSEPSPSPPRCGSLGGLAADCPLLHLQRFYRTRGRYPGPDLSFDDRLVAEALGVSRNSIVLPGSASHKIMRRVD